MLPNGFGYNPLKRPRYGEGGDLLPSLMACFSSRVVRGGPKLLVYLVVSLVLSFTVLRFVVQELSQAASGTTKAVWHWHTGESWDASKKRIKMENTLGYGEDGLGNFRIVVFGERDIATPISKGKRGIAALSWTDVMCEELHCSTYLSFVPREDDKQSMVSIGLYATAIEEIAQRSATDATGPGEDFSFQAEQFPVAWEKPDLEQQVSAFLDMDKPTHTPRETLYVFTFGTWDIWSLASLHEDYGRQIVGKMTDYIYEQAERLYHSSLNTSSIAYTDTHGDLQSRAVRERQVRTDKFRIFMPRLYDPTMTPAWSTARPDLGDAHPIAEQHRTATALVEEWNNNILIKMDRWVRGPSTDNHQPPAARSPEQVKKDALAAKKALDAQDITREILSTHSALEKRDTRGPRPPPQRDGFLFDLPVYILDSISENQLRASRLKDGNGRGGKPIGEGFKDVKEPCSEAVSTKLCEMMQENLFVTPWTVAPRAVRNIGETAAETVVRNGTVRRGWEER